MIKCEGCDDPAKYVVYGQPHCLKHMLEAIECRCYVEVRWIEDADGYPNQSE